MQDACDAPAGRRDLGDAEYVRGETHALRDGLWVATGWLNIAPDGYSEDILDTVGG
ncbi:hypothetical protein [Microbacterium lushaniae]|uniref:hypothetical protein n=1 Tax=Microbacterium lushaniae TaxID=2614639 RepID=UPI00177ADB38|nr:hypothetical protein [Microbacterium lushaniae]